MLKERETYTATKGVENEGYEFEVGMLAFYCFHLCYNNAVKDFKIAIYDDQYHPFDDIVIEITTEVSEKYAIQLKHVKDKLVLNSNHFGKNGKMVLNKYFKYDFTKSNHVVLLTNGVVNEEITVGNCHIKVKTSLSEMEKCLDTSSEENDHIYEISNEDTSNKITFYTSQKSRNDIDEAIKAKFKAKFFLNDVNVDSVIQKFKNFFQQWKKGSFKLCKLDKEDIRMKITEILFYEHIVDYKPRFESCIDKKTLILHNILNGFNVTVVQDVDEDALSSLCRFEENKLELVENGQKLLVSISENAYKELAIILWRLKKFPLIVEVKADNENLIYELINDLENESLSFILVGNISRRCLETKQVFENLLNLQEHTYFEETIEEFTLSIQGQKKISLKKLNQCNARFFEIITMKELLLISKGNFVIGDTEEELPQPYIERRLITTTLKIDSIENFQNDLFAISGCDHILKQKLPKWRFWRFEEFVEKMSLGNSIPIKSIILCDETAKSFATCLKYEKRNVHCLKVLDNEHLQLIYSKEKSDHLRQFQVFPENKLDCVLKNNINLVCARPGMGKMTMLKYLRKNSPPGYWTVKVDLQEEQQFQYNFDHNSSFETKIRDCFKEVRKLIFFFCGVDNLQNDSLIKATEYIKQVAKDNFKVWVFSEDHLKEALEKIFEVSSMDIEEFSEEEQQRYIQERLKDRNVDQGVEKVLQSFKMLKNNDILGAPMHLYMLTEIFINDPKAIMEEIFVLTDIYRYFIKTKYKHYLEKVCSDAYHHNQIIDDGIYYRTEQYKLAAISSLGLTWLNCNAQCDRNFLEQLGRIGDVVGIIFKVAADRSLIFSQQTYADYFAALWLANNYQKVKNIREFILREDFKNILFMFNLEICRKHEAHIAVLYQNYEQLLDFESKLNEMDPLRRSPLHLAIFYGTKLPRLNFTEEETSFKFNSKEILKEDTLTKRIVDFLISNMTIDPYQTEILFGWTLYDCAFSVLNLYVIENLLKTFPQTRGLVLDKLNSLKDYFTVVYYSLKFGYNHLFRLTSEVSSFAKALSMENCNGERLIYLAVKSGNYDNVKVLLDKGANANTIASTYNQRSILHLAVESGHSEIVKLLLDKGASFDIMDRYRNTPLHIASSKGIYESAELLLNSGSDVNFADNFGRTSLQLAATHGHLPILLLLLRHSALIDKSDKFGNSPLSCAQDKNHHDIVNVLSRKGATTPTTLTRRLSANEYDEYTSYQLHWVAYTGQAERIEPLLHDGWNINQVDHYGRTPLYRAVTEKHLRIVEMFIDKGADINIPDNNKIVPLCKAISNCDYAITSLLLKRDASLDVQDNFGYTPLHWTAMFGNAEIIKLLLTKTPDLDATDKFGRKPVDCAVENGHVDVVTLLEDEGSKLIEVARERSTFLEHYANIVNKVNRKSNLTPFEEAVDSGNHSLVRKFLRQGKDLNKCSADGHTILHRAVIRKHGLIVELLLEKGVKLDTLDKCHSSILHWAALTGDVEIVKLLTKRNVEINVADQFGYNPLELAAINGHYEVVTSLLKADGNANVVDICGNCPLDWACKKGYIQCVQVLLENGVAARSLEERDFLNLAKEQRTFLKRALLY